MSKSKKPAEPEQPKLEDLVDEFGDCKSKVEAVAAFAKRAESLRAQILTRVGVIKPEATKDVHGSRHVVTISAQSNQRTVGKLSQLSKRIGLPKFLASCTFPLKALELVLSGEEAVAYVTESRTGPRTVTVAPRVDSQA